MSYTAAQMDAAVAALVAAIHGIHPDVARAWATAEQGVNYNILGVTWEDASGQHLFRYTSWAQGAEAAAHLIATGPYGGVRAALAGGTSQQQAAAIVASPWNHPYYTTGAGAALLRSIASSGGARPVGTVVITGPTPIRDATGRTTGQEVTRATYGVGRHVLVHGLWLFPITDHPGWWIRPTRYTRFS